MYWGCITFDGTGALVKCPMPFNSQSYIKTLEHASIQHSGDFGMKYMDDKAPIHRSFNVCDWKYNNNVNNAHAHTHPFTMQVTTKTFKMIPTTSQQVI